MPVSGGSAGRRLAEQRLADRRRAARQPSETPLVWVALAVGAGGIAAGRIPAGLDAGPITLGCLSASLLCVWAGLWKSKADAAGCMLLLASVATLAGAWTDAAWRWFPAKDLGRFARQDAEPVCCEALVRGVPVVYAAEGKSPFRAIPPSDQTVFEIEVIALRDGVHWRSAAGRCEVTIAGRQDDLIPGERLRLFGQLRSPTPAMNLGQRDAASRARAERRLARIWTEAPECVTRIAPTDDWLANRLWRTRAWSLEALEEHLTAEAVPLARAMLLGDGSGLSDSTVEAFRKTGALHVLVVSGLHVGLVACLLPALGSLGLMPRRLAWLGALGLVVLYVTLVGARPSALRAGIVAASACVAALSGRRVLSLNSLAGAGVAVFAIQPGAWSAVGTQLSFLAAATLLVISSWIARRTARPTPPLERLIESTRSPLARLARRGLRGAGWVIAATLAVQAVSGPLVASEFHLVSPAAAPLALVISPLIPLSIGSGLVLLGAESLGLLWGPQLAGFVCGSAVHAMGETVRIFSEAPYAGFWAPGPADWWSATWIAYCGLGALLGTYGVRVRPYAVRGGALLAAAAFGPTLWSLADEPKLACHFLAVGHGSATLLISDEGRAVLVDAGALGAPDRVTDTVARALWSRGVTRLDAILLTHPDVDHYNAVPGLLERFPIESVWTTTRMFPRFLADDDRSGPAELARRLDAAQVPRRILRRGDRLRLGASRLEVLHPDELGVIGSDNANSLVLGIEYAGRRILLPGDLESPGLEALLTQEPYDCDLLLAPHHGSRRSDPPGFAAWSRPERVVISSGQQRGEADRAYRQAGAEVYSTRRSGQVTAQVTPNGIRINSFR